MKIKKITRLSIGLLAAMVLVLMMAACGGQQAPPVAVPLGTAHVGDWQASGSAFIDGQSDAVQLKVQGHSTQTSNPFVVEISDGTDKFTVSNAGAVVAASSVTADSATLGGGYGSTGATISTAGVGQFDGALTTGGALTIGEGALADSTIVSADIKDGEIVNADVSAAADIAVSKLEDADTAGKFIVADASNHPAYVAMSGDSALGSDGAVTIQADAVENSMITQGTAGQVLLSNATPDTAWTTLSNDIAIGGDGSATIQADAVEASMIAQGTAGQVLLSNATPDTAWTSLSGDVHIDGAGATTIQADAVEASMVAQGTSGQFLMSNATPDTAWQSLSGDVSVAGDGAVTIGADAVEASMVAQGTAGQVLMSNATPDTAWGTISGDATLAGDGSLTIAANAVETGMIKDGEIVNADVSTSAAISLTKLEDGGTAADFIVADASTHPAWVAMSGDVGLGNDGATTIQADAVENSMILQGTAGQVLMSNATPDTAWGTIGGDATLAGDGSLTIAANAVEEGMIKDGEIVNADVNASAALDATKIADGSVTSAEFQYVGDVTGLIQAQIDGKQATVTEGSLTDSVILSADVKDDVLVDADINSAAAIAATKIADGSVTSAEFQYLGDVTGLLQAQVDGKEATVTEGSLTDSVIVSGDIKDDTIVDADINSAADISYTKLDDVGVVKWATKSITWTTGAGGSDTLLTMGAGTIYFINSVFIETTAEWTATAGDDEHVHVGDDLDVDGFIVAGNTELKTTFTEATGYPAGWYGVENGSGGAYTLDDGGPFVYDNASGQTIDVAWGATGDDLTGGSATVYVVYMRIQ